MRASKVQPRFALFSLGKQGMSFIIDYGYIPTGNVGSHAKFARVPQKLWEALTRNSTHEAYIDKKEGDPKVSKGHPLCFLLHLFLRDVF
jgi:hypothetical protein